MDHRRIGVQFLTEEKDISLFHTFHIGSGALRPFYAVVTGVFSPGTKRLKREADHSPPSSPEVKNA
jgi:hypothetical protein